MAAGKLGPITRFVEGWVKQLSGASREQSGAAVQSLRKELELSEAHADLFGRVAAGKNSPRDIAPRLVSELPADAPLVQRALALPEGERSIRSTYRQTSQRAVGQTLVHSEDAKDLARLLGPAHDAQQAVLRAQTPTAVGPAVLQMGRNDRQRYAVAQKALAQVEAALPAGQSAQRAALGEARAALDTHMAARAGALQRLQDWVRAHPGQSRPLNHFETEMFRAADTALRDVIERVPGRIWAETFGLGRVPDNQLRALSANIADLARSDPRIMLYESGHLRRLSE